MASALILIGGHLSTAPRPFKEAGALARAGWDVTVHGVWSDEILAERDRVLVADAPFRFVTVADLRPLTPRRALARLEARARARVARFRYRRFGRFSPELLGYGARATLREAARHPADLTIAHSESGLWVASQLRSSGRRVGVDFEDWFSEDLLLADRVTRPVSSIQSLERQLACDASLSLAPSRAMARALASAYGAREPTVIYNSFPRVARLDGLVRDRRDPRALSLHWFSQTIGPGRGLELLFRALPGITVPVEVHLRGATSSAVRAWMERELPPALRATVFVHVTVPNGELPSRIAEHDVGLALESSSTPSRNLTATNKLFQYLHGGLPVIATDTAGQREVLDQCPGAGVLVSDGDPAALAGAINHFGQSRRALLGARDVAREAGARLAWETQEPRLVAAACAALSHPASR